MDLEWIKYLIVAIVSLIGWFVGHFFTSKRDVANKRREIRLEHLLEAYRHFESAANRKERTRDQDSSLESAVATIQLLGTERQVNIVLNYLRAPEGDGKPSIDEILQSLRKDIRGGLDLKELSDPITVFRLT